MNQCFGALKDFIPYKNVQELPTLKVHILKNIRSYVKPKTAACSALKNLQNKLMCKIWTSTPPPMALINKKYFN